MIIVRRADERRSLLHGGETKLSFREGERTDPLGEGFYRLRNIAEHSLPPGAGLPPAPGSDVLTYVVEGAVMSNQDSAGSVPLHAGCFELLLSGEGARRKIVGACDDAGPARVIEVRLWGSRGKSPSAVQRERFCTGERRGNLRLVASPNGAFGSLKLQQDSYVLSVLMDFGQHIVRELAPERRGWIHVVRGEVAVSSLVLTEGDGAGFSGERSISITAQAASELLVIDLGAEPIVREEQPSLRLMAEH